ncbi:MAG: NupC/NupG family nucleoside CNT transporter, partial [Calditrichaeota bacterium]|nr:NupC/NupG family nucleoside CNT transporter [Calditrichota bacterium]
MIWGILNGFLGIAVLLGIVYGLSANRAAIKWRTVITGLMMQFIIASMLLLKIEIGGTDILYPFKWMIQTLSQLFVFIINFTVNGSKFIFGPLADSTVMNNIFPNNGFVFAFMALTTIIFFGSFMAILYHLGVMQFIIRIMARLMVKFLNISGSEAIAVTANIFVGQTEAPLVIKPYVKKMTKSELLTLMIGGMATIAGGV